jgi:hypothetical protein
MTKIEDKQLAENECVRLFRLFLTYSVAVSSTRVVTLDHSVKGRP